MQIWRYICREVSWEDEDTLDNLGTDGWELVSYTLDHGTMYCVFKRPGY